MPNKKRVKEYTSSQPASPSPYSLHPLRHPFLLYVLEEEKEEEVIFKWILDAPPSPPFLSSVARPYPPFTTTATPTPVPPCDTGIENNGSNRTAEEGGGPVGVCHD